MLSGSDAHPTFLLRPDLTAATHKNVLVRQLNGGPNNRHEAHNLCLLSMIMVASFAEHRGRLSSKGPS